MTKSFKKFRDEIDDEWGEDDDFRSKKKALKDRRDERRKKNADKYSIFDSNEE